jgi:hypothetical protein
MYVPVRDLPVAGESGRPVPTNVGEQETREQP